MSEVINWLSRSKGPEAVVIYADFYDYDLNTNIFKLPEEKEGVLKLINSLIDELENQLNSIDDILFRLDLSPPDRNKSDQTFENMRTQVSNNRIEWAFEEIEEKGLEQVKLEIAKHLDISWESDWNLNGWVNDSQGTHEFDFKRWNLV